MNRVPARRKTDAEIQAEDRRFAIKMRVILLLGGLSIICLFLTAIAAIITWGVVQVMTNDDPPWLKLVTLIVGALSGGSATSAPGWLMYFRFRRYMLNHSARMIDAELAIDPARSTSNLRLDGTHDLD